jgi:hypothetical protein
MYSRACAPAASTSGRLRPRQVECESAGDEEDRNEEAIADGIEFRVEQRVLVFGIRVHQATPASSRMGMIRRSDVARRMIPTSSGFSTTPAACNTMPVGAFAYGPCELRYGTCLSVALQGRVAPV